jgi:hypothetical protein
VAIEIGQGIVQLAVHLVVDLHVLSCRQHIEPGERSNRIIDTGHPGRIGRRPGRLSLLTPRVVTFGHPATVSGMADLDECRTAIAALAARLGTPGENRADGLDRSVSARVTDLGVTFRGHLHDGVLDDIVTDTSGEEPGVAPAKIRLELSSADLLLLSAGELSLGTAWISGRVKIHATLADLLRLRSLT